MTKPVDFYTGVLLGHPPDATAVSPIDVMSYLNQQCTADTLADSARTFKEEGYTIVSATIYKCDLDGNNELVQTLDLDEVFWPAGPAV
mgnify:CR=1 FL=1